LTGSVSVWTDPRCALGGGTRSYPRAEVELKAAISEQHLADYVNPNNDRVRLKTKDGPTGTVQETRFAPSDIANWHKQPGFALIAVSRHRCAAQLSRDRRHARTAPPPPPPPPPPLKERAHAHARGA
jgi:hypothetical protein